jgi:2-O-methyltransferase
MTQDRFFALTSIAPAPGRAVVQKRCVQSWQDAGLQVLSFNHPSEMASLESFDNVEFVSVTNEAFAATPLNTDGRFYVPIKVMLNWAAAHDAVALIINSDIELRLPQWALNRMRWLSDDGLCYFVRYNHAGDATRAQVEPYGIDAFMLNGRNADLFPESSLSMGQPFWDYWLPYTLARNGRTIFSVESPVAFHRVHPQRWNWEDWHRCALEFDRVTGALEGDRSLQACHAMAHRTRQFFDGGKKLISREPMEIRQWVQHTFANHEPKMFLELGAHCGTDTVWMARLPAVTIHAFEPDPRNWPPPLPNVTLHRAAVADRDGTTPFILSQQGWGQEWTHSSSIRVPKNHLKRYPVTFGDTIEVSTFALDTFSRQRNLGVVDFIWADIQGAEAEMIRGGRETLARTRYLYTEYSDEELYEGQATLRDILELLPDFRVVELWPDDVLLKNQFFNA